MHENMVCRDSSGGLNCVRITPRVWMRKCGGGRRGGRGMEVLGFVVRVFFYINAMNIGGGGGHSLHFRSQ